MDHDTLVIELTDSGKRLIDALAAAGFDVQTAFWAKPTEEGKWLLYIASPIVEKEGPTRAYRMVHDVIRQNENLWIDPLDVRVVGLTDSLAEAAAAVIRPKVADGPFAVKNPKPYPGMTRFGGSVLGGVSIEGAYIYPSSQPAA